MNTPMNPLNTQIYEEATEWIILHRGDDLDAEAKRRFDAWVRESPQHLRAYLEMSTIWEDVPALNHNWNPSADELILRAREHSSVFPLGVERASGAGACGDVVTTEATGRQQSTERAVKVPALRFTPMKLLAIAATLILTVGVSGWLYLQRDLYSTDIGEQRNLALEDGSRVELNAGTKIRVMFTQDARTIELLQGQALFKVAKDPSRPFVVDSDGAKIRAVGTQFDVYKKSTGTQVTVVEGRVAVLGTVPVSGHSGLSGQSGEVPNATPSSANATQGFPGPSWPTSAASSHAGSSLSLIPGEVLLSAGEQIVIAQAGSAPEFDASQPNDGAASTMPGGSTPERSTVLTPQAANVEAATAWTHQRLVFDFAPLVEVAEEFNRYNHRPMKIECEQDDALCTFNISGTFSSTDPTLLLRFLRDQPGIVVTETSSEIRISRESAATD